MTMPTPIWKTAILLHGMPSKKEYYDASALSPSHNHRLPWLQKQLLIHDVCAQTPEMPCPYSPAYTAWKEVFTWCPLHDDTILVGHSCGAGFLLRYLSEHDISVGNVILVAPRIDPTHELDTGMFDFVIDPTLMNKTKNLVIFASTDDMPEVQQSIQIIQQHLPDISTQVFKNYGHFCLEDMKTPAFPELFKACLEV